MLRSELIEKVAKLHPHLRPSDVERVVKTIFKEIGNAFARGARIEIRGFGIFSLKHRKARTGRNPRTGTTVEVPRKVIPFFKTGKYLHASVNDES